MEKLTLMKVAELSKGRCAENAPLEKVVRGVSTDSRELCAGDLFVALKGDRFNGHDFLEEAAQKGAVAAMVERDEMRRRTSTVPLVFVDEALVGLQNMAHNYRCTLPVRTVAVAGSNGKTGTKEMVSAVLDMQFLVFKNKGNLNNHIGVPMSLLQLDALHEIGVFEVGTNHPGELILLLEMVQPLAGIITMIGEEHLEYFHDLEGVVKEEGSLAEVLPPEGLLVLNADDGWSSSIARRSKTRVVTFGFSEGADYRATTVDVSFSGTRFKMITPKGEQEITLNLLGRHQVVNALAAGAVGEFFGLDLNQIRQGLETVTPIKMRMEPRVTQRGVWIINDAYNANPNSMRAALEMIRDLPVKGRRFAVLGEMRELGAASKLAHQEVGRKVVESGIDLLIVVGEKARPIIEGARSTKRGVSRVEFFCTSKEAGEFVRKETSYGDVVLIKASRGVALETVLEGWL